MQAKISSRTLVALGNVLDILLLKPRDEFCRRFACLDDVFVLPVAALAREDQPARPKIQS
jgi:hypothetical protein